MRSRSNCFVTDQQVQAHAESFLRENLAFEDAGWKCTAAKIWSVLLFAAARMTSLFAACQDLADAPSDDAVRKTLAKWLPKRTQTLEAWFAPVLAGQWLPRALFRKSRYIAIDWHSIPYHGEPQRWSNELCHGKPKSGTTKFHTYATACVVHKGMRYTLAVTSVKRNETVVAVTARLLKCLANLGLSIKALLMDRQFCTSAMMADLQSRNIPHVTPVMFRGRKAQRQLIATRRAKARTFRDFQHRPAGRYRFTWTGPQKDRQTVEFDVVVSYKGCHNRKTGKRRSKKLLFAAWRVPGTPVEIRELYRLRFGIESSYRQLGQARIRTSTRSPVERLLFVLIALVLRNLWVWLHWIYFAEAKNGELILHLERLRFRRMLDWIARGTATTLHDGSAYVT
jgi:hypothetical protein